MFKRKPKVRGKAIDSLPNGDVLFREGLSMLLGSEAAAEVLDQLEEQRREFAYEDRVRRMERLIELRRRELAAAAELESLR